MLEGVTSMNRFYKENDGKVIEKIILLAVVATLVLLLFPKLRAFTMCTYDRATTSIHNVLFENKIESDCSKYYENDKGEEGKGEEGGIGGDGSGGGSVPIDEFENSDMDLTCAEMYPYYNFTVSEAAPPQSIGTKSIKFTNKKDWDMWIKVSDIKTKDGLKITTNDQFYRKLSGGEEVTFNVGWKWDVPGNYKGNKGSAVISFFVKCKPPEEKELYKPKSEAPKNFRVTDTKDTSISLAWDKVEFASEYYLYRNNMIVYKGSDLNYIDQNILPGTTYTYKLFTAQTAGTNVFETLQQKTTGISPIPAAPSNVTVLNKTHDTIYFNWKREDKATHYKIFLDGKDLGNTVWTGYIRAGLKPNTEYKIEVLAENLYGKSEKTPLVIKTNDIGGLSNPSNFKQIDKTKTSQTLAWDPVPGAKTYILMSGAGVVYKGPNLSATHKGIGEGSTVHYFLFSENDEQRSSGLFKSFTVDGIYIPTVPYNIAISNITNEGMSINWTKGSGAEKTVIKMNGEEIYNGTDNKLLLSDLTPNTYYGFEFYSTNSRGNSQVTKNSVFTTNDTYDDEAYLNATCKDERYTQTLKFPSTIKVGGNGVFSINTTNNSNFDLSLKISKVDKKGGLFEGKTPVTITYDDKVFNIKPKEKFSIPIKWSLPANADASYTKESGELIVTLETDCKN